MKYKKKPVVIEAFKWTGENLEEIKAFTADVKDCGITPNGEIIIPTLEGNMMATRGDWIIKGIKGEFYPCKPDIFEATYESVKL